MDVDAFMQTRSAAFHGWSSDASTPGELLGSGKYGKVFRTSKPGTVLKESVTTSRRVESQRQAFSEHAIGILQTLLVLRGYTPHLPLHFGTHIGARRGEVQGQLYMEQFCVSLDSCGAAVLTTPEAWLSLAFQVSHALSSLADILHLTHNDVYPRNVLLRRHEPLPSHACYRLRSQRFLVPWPFFVALTDFGIASLPALVGGEDVPAAVSRVPAEPVSDTFGCQPPARHILHYKTLPIFSRDLYTIFKWIAYSSRALPKAPVSVIKWAAAALQRLDRTRDRFAHFRSVGDFVSDCFQPSQLAATGLPSLEAPDGTRPHFNAERSEEERADLLREGADVLARLPVPASRSQATPGKGVDSAKTDVQGESGPLHGRPETPRRMVRGEPAEFDARPIGTLLAHC